MNAVAHMEDWQREREIRRLAETCKAHMRAKDRAAARIVWEALRRELLARSPNQVARMEARMWRRVMEEAA